MLQFLVDFYDIHVKNIFWDTREQLLFYLPVDKNYEYEDIWAIVTDIWAIVTVATTVFKSSRKYLF